MGVVWGTHKPENPKSQSQTLSPKPIVYEAEETFVVIVYEAEETFCGL